MSGTQLTYYFICHRKLWLFTHSIDMEHNSDDVLYGKHISESTYKREKHEIKIDDIVIDFYDDKNKIIHEIKKSNKMEETHIWQVKYYISVLESKGVSGVKGKIDYPEMRETVDVILTDEDRIKLNDIKTEIKNILDGAIPPVIDKPYCKKCSYYDLCFV
ncbi:MAG: CRISPR-associated protein Cas4 [Ignavibacteriales bacterium]|nr:CRISPR-associated protein Cas4 [Ignavibacteriales bacterium]